MANNERIEEFSELLNDASAQSKSIIEINFKTMNNFTF